jgi:acyl-CoA thioester hydrolase
MTRHISEIRPRWADMDAYAHVNNVAWSVYVQEARAQMFGFRLRGTPGQSLLGSLVVARMRMWFHRPLVLTGSPLTARTWISELRAATVTVVCELHDDADSAGVAYCRARTVLAPFDFTADRPRRLTPEETATLQPFVEAAEPAHVSPAR